jgi:hypothetical protein
LRVLDLLGLDGLTDPQLARSLRSAGARHLRTLHLSEIAAVGLPQHQALSAVAECCAELRALHLLGVTGGGVAAGLLEVARCCTRLEALDLSATEGALSHEELGEILRLRGGMLRELHLLDCRSLGDDTLECIAKHCPNLRLLDVSYCQRVGDAGLQCLAKAAPPLHTLLICGCSRVRLLGLTDLGPRLAQLRRLDARDIGLGDMRPRLLLAHLVAVMAALVMTCPRLVRLTMNTLAEGPQDEAEEEEEEEEEGDAPAPPPQPLEMVAALETLELDDGFRGEELDAYVLRELREACGESVPLGGGSYGMDHMELWIMREDPMTTPQALGSFSFVQHTEDAGE